MSHGTKRNETKRNETKRNETKNKTKRNTSRCSFPPSRAVFLFVLLLSLLLLLLLEEEKLRRRWKQNTFRTPNTIGHPETETSRGARLKTRSKVHTLGYIPVAHDTRLV